MRIVQVAPRYPPHTGGVETHVAAIAERLVDCGHEVTVLTADAGSDVATHERRDGVSVVRYRGFAPGGAFHVAPGLVPAVRGLSVDLIHAHNYHSLPLVFAALSARAPLVATPHYHGASASALRDRLLTLYRPLGRWALSRTRAVIAVSEWERRRLAADLGVEATVIPNGVDTARFDDPDPVRREAPYLLCVGRLEAYKGVQHAIRALPTVSGYELVVVGDGPYRETLERIAVEVGVADRVTFLGYVADDRLAGLYAGAAVHLVLSSFEAYGLTVAESLYTGTPVVVRTAAALSEWADRPGCVGIEAVDPAAVATAIREAVEVEPVGAVPTWDDVCERTLTVYERVLAG